VTEGLRLRRLRSVLRARGLDGLLVTGPENRRYLSGFTGSSAYLLVGSRAGQWLATDFRYWEQAAEQAAAFTLLRLESGALATVAGCMRAAGWRRVGFEAAHCTYEFTERLRQEAADLELVATSGVIEELRLCKDGDEIDLIAAAAAIVDAVWEDVLDIIKPGLAERELALEMEYRLRRQGAEGLAFPIIVASGPRGALPHAEATERQLAEGEMVTVDVGAVYRGYCSDMTRTVVVGRGSAEQRRVWEVVRAAQETALAGLRPGLTCREADALARQVIAAAGFGDCFGHGLGHGVGLAVHEEPRLGPGTDPDGLLQAGMVVTVEPGIYRPGWGGVRLEDLVVLQDDGAQLLSHARKDFELPSGERRRPPGGCGGRGL